MIGRGADTVFRKSPSGRLLDPERQSGFRAFIYIHHTIRLHVLSISTSYRQIIIGLDRVPAHDI